MALIVLSFDGVSDKDFEAMASKPNLYPNIARLKDESHYKGGIRSVFVSNTYPTHAAVSTGKLPYEHGVISNYKNAGHKKKWAQEVDCYKTETIWDVAKKRGYRVASVFWPTTCKADIEFNMPEVHTRVPLYQLSANLRNGNSRFQTKMLMKYGRSLLNFSPVGLDSFITSVVCDVYNGNKMGLILAHFYAYDLISHKVGSKSALLEKARRSLDRCVGKLLELADDATLLVFSDHGHFDVNETVDLRRFFYDAVYEQCGGCAFFKELPRDIETFEWFERMLSEQEMIQCGYLSKAAFGIAAKRGYDFSDKGKSMSNHGYPIDYEDYNVFYLLRAKNGDKILKDAALRFGDLRDVTLIISQSLGLEMEI